MTAHRGLLQVLNHNELGVFCIVTACLFFGIAAPVQAASLRCPEATIAGPGLTSEELGRIKILWRDLDTETAGSDGPLGCPTVAASIFSDARSSMQGVLQQFQRGAIYLGRGSWAGTEIVGVRGLDIWTIWFRNITADHIFSVNNVSPLWPDSPSRPAHWNHQGTIMYAPAALRDVALWDCKHAEIPGSCRQKTPFIKGSGRVFDVAARLEPALLSYPDVSQVSGRINALFPPWLSCFMGIPSPTDIGESSIASLAILVKRSTPCPLTGDIPSNVVNTWLSTFVLPSDAYPGTGTDNEDCPRKGELDVALTQLLKLVMRYREELQTHGQENVYNSFIGNVLNQLSPWGGQPRPDPYITNYTCYKYFVIESENHILLQETARYLINGLLASRNNSIARGNAGNREWLVRFMQQISRRDFYEFNSIPYTRYQLKALLALHDYASDEKVRVAATGLLHWLFTKQALSGSLDRDLRPYRRRPDSDIWDSQGWATGALNETGGTAKTSATATTIEGAVLSGPLQHIAEHMNLPTKRPDEVSGQAYAPGTVPLCSLPESSTNPYCDVKHLPDLGTIDPYFKEFFVDIADSGYRLPAALAGWFQSRFMTDESNRVTYLQAINHTTKIAEDPRLFKQANSGVEIMSGNRNWTMVGGGSPAPPGDPGPVPSESGIGFLDIPGDDVARTKQNDAVWDDQPGILRETVLIPTGGAVDRSQTLRFGTSVPTTPERQYSRLCVAEGFMCGYDLRMPANPFPRTGPEGCLIKINLPAAAEALAKKVASTEGNDLTARDYFGCPTKYMGRLQSGWSIWTYEHGVITMATDPVGQERIAVAWVEESSNRKLHVAWQRPGRGHNWYRVHVYNFEVNTRSGEPPGGWLAEPVYGNPDGKKDWDSGEHVFSLNGIQDTEWQIILVGCDGNVGVPGHDCTSDIYPKLRVSVAIPPAEHFSCAAHEVSGPIGRKHHAPEGIVLEIGNACSNSTSPFGFYLFVFQRDCSQCHDLASDYGFVVVSPSRGWRDSKEFEEVILASIAESRVANGRDYEPSSSNFTKSVPRNNFTVAVPISPPVVRVPNTDSTTEEKYRWERTGPPSKHTVSFRWPVTNGASILEDTGVNTFQLLKEDPPTWPLALGHIRNPDFGFIGPLLSSDGKGCFTFSGLPTKTNPNPLGLVVDIRSVQNPRIREEPSATLGGACQ